MRKWRANRSLWCQMRTWAQEEYYWYRKKHKDQITFTFLFRTPSPTPGCHIYGQCVLPFTMYGRYCQLFIQLQILNWRKKYLWFLICVLFKISYISIRIWRTCIYNKLGQLGNKTNGWQNYKEIGGKNKAFTCTNLFGLHIEFYLEVFSLFLGGLVCQYLEVELAQASFSLARVGRHEQEQESDWNAWFLFRLYFQVGIFNQVVFPGEIFNQDVFPGGDF